ncbi:MAG: MFS transporter [Actinomycetota bacterium]|nr:MFS transporter [Actinomycetota bacterium]
MVGALVGQERSLIPLLAEGEFGLSSGLATSLFLVTFGLAKAPSNLISGLLAERFGPRRTLIAGWLVGLPVPLLLMWAPSWGWVIAANLLLGINQGLTWSTTVLMKIQLAGDHELGRAVGLNEFAGYAAVGLSALAPGMLAKRFGVRRSHSCWVWSLSPVAQRRASSWSETPTSAGSSSSPARLQVGRA